MDVELAEAIKALRSQLTEAMRDGDGEKVRFTVDKIDLDLELTVTKGAEGGLSWKVFSVGASAKGDVSKVSVQRLHLELSARTDEDEPVRLSGRRPI
ncbi:trypco2 family protein [Glycomyces tenuis]|uniref:trypco2 family protein n=1 Tax=Glycomyces tenuis TaxID=58116 RepID=UPI000412EB5B|nr:trypco2 family protein [Glycomyces tenuis]